MKTFALTAFAFVAALGSAQAADYTYAPASVEIIAPATPAAPPMAVISEKLTAVALLSDGWQPVRAALVPTSGVPGTNGLLAHSDASVLMLYKNGVYIYCAVAQAGGAYNNCHVAGPGTR
ncbi:hypothetical protein GCM10007301_49490 [Azorhizobium oxalatiphilum]|uniref:Uncharacterized protein n=1 Tax=Azorhizobium oxalatiphilum TaxID=980631 RepID=A0A917FGN1_9HYPH|nr:hypothetical protein [Azorhizobium oxalatiphilum]GGF83548.1 hypothetical protein GCM10007301_49490 [Azorhizobium oxalatiphilum]